jgi:chromosome segregation ATPase
MAERPGDIKRVVLSRTLQHPLTLYPTAVGVLGAVGIGLFGPVTVAVAAAVAGLGVGLGHLATQVFVRPDSVAAQYFRELHEQLSAKRAEMLADLEARLKKAAALEGCRNYGDQALKQLRMVQQRFETMQELLAAKFESTELTYSRYFVAGEQAFLAVLDTLDSIVSRMQSACTIDPKYYEERMNATRKQKAIAPADEEELRTLKERMTLRSAQLDAVNTLLTFNENAITEFDRVNAAIAEVKGAKSQTAVDLESAMRELETLAQRAQKLSG